MTLLEFGCPPLPIANGKRAESDEPAVVNSHDLMAAFMLQAFRQQDADLNRSREERQRRAAEAYRRRLLQEEEDPYGAMSEYTRDYLASYLLPPYSVDDVHVLSAEHISPALLAEIRRYHDALCPEAAGVSELDLLLRGCRDVCVARFGVQ